MIRIVKPIGIIFRSESIAVILQSDKELWYIIN